MPKPVGPTIITVCTSCRAAEGARAAAPGKTLLAAIELEAAGSSLVVRPTQCLSVCTRVCTVSLTSQGGYTFLFGDLDALADAPAVVRLAKACAEANYGFVPWKDRPEVLRKGMIARVPPPNWSPEDGSAPA